MDLERDPPFVPGWPGRMQNISLPRCWFSYADSYTDNFCLSSVQPVFHADVFLLGLVPYCLLWKADCILRDVLWKKILFSVSFKDNGFRSLGKGLSMWNGESLLHRNRHRIEVVVLGQVGTFTILGPSVGSKGYLVKCQEEKICNSWLA